MEIIGGCVGCGICVLMCTHHFLKTCHPSRSSLELKKIDKGSVLDKERWDKLLDNYDMHGWDW